MGDPITAAAAMSVVYSWYNFYVKGDKETGIFVVLWVPTRLGGYFGEQYTRTTLSRHTTALGFSR
ncbi:hypothetical protein [Saliphagus infecundisoli]|uniref:Uncharacterized protein n=1 Tax=Saliphagus infecundisoli TaxID=1849069 RepID=A0ABD5QJX5_9EURY|nr:hypothetical protein [Saliphagus infecundisoli]